MPPDHRQTRREARREARAGARPAGARPAGARPAGARLAPGPRPTPGPRWALPLLAGGVVVIAAVLAVALSGMGAGGGSSTVPPSTGASATLGSSSGPVIAGASLPNFENPDGDPAVGLSPPVVTGTAFDGSPTAIKVDGRPKVVMFLAHWCTHCQAEVPLIQAWLDAGGGPDDVDLVSVITAIDSTRPNYPPDEWLEREGWTVPVVVDTSGNVAAAYGLTAFPFWTFIGADGTVRARAVGEMAIADLETTIATIGR